MREKDSALDRAAVLAVVALGWTSIITQTILLRELLSTYQGNELVIGVILANWMVLTGIGSFLGRHSTNLQGRGNLVVVVLLVLSLLPPTLVAAIRALRNILFPVGTMIDLVGVVWTSLVLLVPYCLLSGFLFAYFAGTIVLRPDRSGISKVYAWESVGSVLGGLLFNLLMVFFLTTFQSFLLLVFANCGVAFFLGLRRRDVLGRYVAPAVALLAAIFAFTVNLDIGTRRWLFAGQELEYSTDTPYGTVSVTRQGEQMNFFENGILLFSTNDPGQSEESVHYAMAQHPNPGTVLLISGGMSGTIPEILKYGVKSIDYVELNPWVVAAGASYASPLALQKVNVIIQDARRYVKTTTCRYDIVLINLPEPSTAQLNRFYTVEFLRELKSVLNPRAVVSMGLSSSADYMSPDARQIRSVMISTLHAVFTNVLILPGMKDYVLASDGQLDAGIASLVSRRGIATVYVNKYYIDDALLRQRSSHIHAMTTPEGQTNMDFSPIAYYQQVQYWLSHFGIGGGAILLVCLLVLGAVALRMNPVSYGVFTGGWAAASMEFLIIISFQILYGYVYQALGVIITVFMAGLAIGSMYARRIVRGLGMREFVLIQIVLAFWVIGFPFLAPVLRAASGIPPLVHGAFVVLTLCIATGVGVEFAVAAQLSRGSVAGVAAELYGVDLIGSALGSLAVSLFLMPLFGMTPACLIVGVLLLSSAAVAFSHRTEYSLPPSGIGAGNTSGANHE